MRHVARVREMTNMYCISHGESEAQIPLQSPMCRGKDNIKVDLKETVS